MMSSIGAYIISILCAAIVCGILTSLVSKNKVSGGIIRMISGILLSIAVVAPLVNMKWEELETYISSVQVDAASAAEEGSQAANAETSAIIKKELEAYILEKAAAMNLTISVQITMTEDFPPQPYSVRLSGSISPYNRKMIENYIASELGIPEERQVWN